MTGTDEDDEGDDGDEDDADDDDEFVSYLAGVLKGWSTVVDFLVTIGCCLFGTIGVALGLVIAEGSERPDP